VFGKENIEQQRHFRPRYVSSDDYKLQFVVSESKIRAWQIKSGGRLVLKKTAEPYVLIASNFHFLPASEDGATHYNIYSPCISSLPHQRLAWHTKKRIKSDKFCARDTPCMIVSTSPLVIEFKVGWSGGFILYTPGECAVNLMDGAMLEMWNNEPGKYGWPLAYEINEDIAKVDYVGREERYFEKLHARYYNLFNKPQFERFEMCAPAFGYVQMHVENEVALGKNGEAYIRTIYRDEQLPLNQYGTYEVRKHPDPPRTASYNDLLKIRVYAKQNVCHFYSDADGGDALRVTQVPYRLGRTGPEYKINALWYREASAPFAYFYMNYEATYILFIPIWIWLNRLQSSAYHQGRC